MRRFGNSDENDGMMGGGVNLTDEEDYLPGPGRRNKTVVYDRFMGVILNKQNRHNSSDGRYFVSVAYRISEAEGLISLLMEHHS